MTWLKPKFEVHGNFMYFEIGIFKYWVSYNTLMAFAINDTIYLNTDKYSKTTSKQMTLHFREYGSNVIKLNSMNFNDKFIEIFETIGVNFR